MTKQHYITTAIIALLACLCIGLSGCSSDLGAKKEVKEWEKEGSPLKLKADKSKLLHEQTVRECAKYKDNLVDMPDGKKEQIDIECEIESDVVKYLYISDKKIVDEKLEKDGKSYNVYKRTKNAVIYKVDKPKDLLGATTEQEYFVGKFYAGDPFYKDPATGDFYQTETATTTIEAYDEQTATSTAEMILSWLGVKEALGACGTSGDPCYTGSGDGWVKNQVTIWSTARDATSGQFGYTDSTNTYTGTYGSNTYVIYRTLWPTNTSAIDDSMTITAATLYLYSNLKSNADNDGNDFISIVQTSQASPTALEANDYDNLGSTEGIDSSEREDITGATASGYVSFALNSTGLSWVSKTGYTLLGAREGHDLLNDSPTGNNYNYLRFSPSETAGTAQDPYLEVTFTAGGGGSTPEPIRQSEFWF